VIEVTNDMIRAMMKQADGSVVFVENKIAQTVLDLGLREYYKLPGRVQTWAGLYATAQRRHEMLKDAA
jgi:hypothetical protein